MVLAQNCIFEVCKKNDEAMILREHIQKILEAGAQAPSGSNSQPWKFEVRGNEITVVAIPERDHPVLNFRYRGTWIAHGALIENISIAAHEFGYNANVKLFPEAANPNVTARIKLEKKETKGDTLFRAIALRTTNRKPYSLLPLSENERKELFRVGKERETPGVAAVFIDDSQKIKELGKAASVNEVVMFENQALHRLLFEEIVWTKKEEERRGKGLLFKTMELKPPAAVIKMLGKWPLMRILNIFGVARAIAKDNIKMYSSAPLVCAIFCGDGDADFVNAGRLMERIWLRATAIGLSSHLMTGVLFMWQRIASGEVEWFSGEHVKLIQGAYQMTATTVGVDNQNIALLFRIGKAEEPSARSFKKPPEIFFK